MVGVALLSGVIKGCYGCLLSYYVVLLLKSYGGGAGRRLSLAPSIVVTIKVDASPIEVEVEGAGVFRR